MTPTTITVHYLNLLPALLVSAMVTMMSARTLRRTQRLRHHGIATQARVLTSTLLDANVEYPPKRAVDVAFRTSAGRDVTTTVKFRADRHTAAGNFIPLRYDPDVPESAMLDVGARPGLREVRSSVLGIVLAAPVAALITVVLLIETAIVTLAPLLNG